MTEHPAVWRPSELSAYRGPLLLNAHIWVWFLEGDAARMTPEVVRLLERVGRSAELRVLDISYREVAV